MKEIGCFVSPHGFGADIVLCKTGYSTVAECVQAGTRVISIARDDFAESTILTDFLNKNLPSISIQQKEFFSGAWLQHISNRIKQPRPAQVRNNGADQVAAFLTPLL